MKLRTDIFLITWHGDYDWLPYLFRSIAKYVTGYDHLTVVLEDADDYMPVMRHAAEAGLTRVVIRKCRQYNGTDYNGRSGQSLEKLRAWSHTNADRILFIDSDCVFIRPINIETDPVISVEKPTIWHTPWDEVGDANCWRQPTCEILGFEPRAECMRRFPFVFPGWFLHRLWEHVGGEGRLRKFPATCDFNVMGNFALEKFPGEFTIRSTHEDQPPQIVRNFWSFHGAGHPDVQRELKALGLEE